MPPETAVAHAPSGSPVAGASGSVTLLTTLRVDRSSSASTGGFWPLVTT
ncbi:hypothetical protein [Nonomuraea recticatena]